uniref:Nudix (nucleoside diphosphate linked moiety X)-type motif 22 n=1 Tax=Astyanax mexicanus TaxID=7994 RepID=W5LCA3_ASTMX
MDPEVSVMLHCALSQGLEEHQIRAEISTRFNRRSSPEIEKHIEAVWNDRVTKEPWLFNGAKFRLHSAELSTSIPSTSMNCVAGDEALQALNSDIFDNYYDSSTFILCHMATRLCLQAVCQGVSEEAISVDLMQDSERAVISEIFSSVCAEIRDEVNVPLSFLSAPVLMGIALNHTSAGRPSAEFYIRCSLTMEEVKDFYWRGGPEAHESTDIVFVNREVRRFLVYASLWSELCPSAKGAVLLYRLVRPDGV